MTRATNKAFMGVMRWKMLFDGEGMVIFIMEDVNSLRKFFLVEKINKFLAVGSYSSQSLVFPIKT